MYIHPQLRRRLAHKLSEFNKAIENFCHWTDEQKAAAVLSAVKDGTGNALGPRDLLFHLRKITKELDSPIVNALDRVCAAQVTAIIFLKNSKKYSGIVGVSQIRISASQLANLCKLALGEEPDGRMNDEHFKLGIGNIEAKGIRFWRSIEVICSNAVHGNSKKFDAEQPKGYSYIAAPDAKFVLPVPKVGEFLADPEEERAERGARFIWPKDDRKWRRRVVNPDADTTQPGLQLG